MNISLNWISDMLGRPLDPADTAHRLTMLGAAVDAVEPLHQDLGDVIVAQVESVARHPNADRLSLCQVNDGARVIEVVCGAPNVTAGKKYPYAPVGATLPGGLKLEARKIRGVLSNGMLCSARELGLGDDHAGILELSTTAAPGTPFTKAVPLADHRLVLDVTANRPDLLCHKGVARELAASDGSVVRLAAIPGHLAETPAVFARTGKPGCGGRCRDHHRGYGRLPAIRRRRHSRPHGRPFPGMAPGAAAERGGPLHQQRGRCHQLHPLRAEPAAPRLRPGETRRAEDRGSPCAPR